MAKWMIGILLLLGICNRRDPLEPRSVATASTGVCPSRRGFGVLSHPVALKGRGCVRTPVYRSENPTYNKMSQGRGGRTESVVLICHFEGERAA